MRCFERAVTQPQGLAAARAHGRPSRLLVWKHAATGAKARKTIDRECAGACSVSAEQAQLYRSGTPCRRLPSECP